ncbi:MAG: alpha/beta hydrolase [Pseudomonadota bacterium]
MRIAKWLLIRVGVLVGFAIAAVAGSVLMALDWERTHSRQTAELPFYEAGAPDGLYQLRANDMVFRARVYGAENAGPGVIMLHGHPETSIMWDGLARAVAEEGYSVIAFDQRGYSPGARPKGVEAYRADNQIADVLAIADHMDFERFHLIGHDWGAVIAWAATVLYPERIETVTAMSIPHPQTLKAMVVDDTPAYIALFSLPWLAEASLLFNDMAGYRNAYSAQSDEEIAEYMRVFSEPGASTAALTGIEASKTALHSSIQPIRSSRRQRFSYMETKNSG